MGTRHSVLAFVCAAAVAGCGKPDGAGSSGSTVAPASEKGSEEMAQKSSVTMKQRATLKTTGTGRVAAPEKGETWASAHGYLALWNGEMRVAELRYEGRPAFFDLRYSDDGKRIFASPAIYDLEKQAFVDMASLTEAYGSGLGTLPVHFADQYRVNAASWSSDGEELVIALEFRERRLPGAGSGTTGMPEGLPRFRVLALSSDLKLVADLGSGATKTPALAVGGKWVATFDQDSKVLSIWSRGDYKKVASLELQSVDELRFSPDDTHLVAVGAESTRIWSSREWTLEAEWSSGSPTESVAFHPTMPLFVTADRKGRIKAWRLGSGEPVLVGSAEAGTTVDDLAFANGGTTLYAVEREHIAVFDLQYDD